MNNPHAPSFHPDYQPLPYYQTTNTTTGQIILTSSDQYARQLMANNSFGRSPSESVKPMVVKNKNKAVRHSGIYNLYSCLDEPYQRVKQQGCSGWRCPRNQFIAADCRPEWN